MHLRPDDEPLRWSAVSAGLVTQVQRLLGFECVAVTRKRHDDMVVLQVQDEVYGTVPGQVRPWADTFCARAADGRAPRLTPDVAEVPAHQDAAALLGMDVAAAVSFPLRGAGDELLGSLCAFSPRRHDAALVEDEPMLEALAGVLGALLAAELRLQSRDRRRERAAYGGPLDHLTGLATRRVWDRRLAAEERRCAAYGLDAGVLAVEVQAGAERRQEGSGALPAAAAALADVAGRDAVVARVGRTELAALLPEADASALEAAAADVRRALAARGVRARVGAAGRGPAGAAAAWRLAVQRLSVQRLDDDSPDRRTAPAVTPSSLPAPRTGTTAEVLVNELLDLARRQLGAGVAFVGEFDGDRRVVRGVSSAFPGPLVAGSSRLREDTYCQRVVDGRFPQVIPDTGALPAALELPVTRSSRIGSYVGVPVRFSDGSLYGTLCCLSSTPDPTLSERDADFLAAIAESMSRVLEGERAARAEHSALVARLEPLVRGESTRMVFQPVVSLLDGRLVGAEALARFAGEPRPVDDWFRDADRAGLTCDLELATARAALVAGEGLPGFLGVNLSATTICSPRFPGLLRGTDPSRLVVEISEHEQIDDYACVLDVLAPLRAEGLRLAVDDAGAGFASLRHVVLLAPDMIKLDISLVRGIDTDPARQALAAAMTTFAGQTGALVVAEGVETQQQRGVLQQAGVTLMQGWLTSGGVSSEQFTARWGTAPPQQRRAAGTRS